MDGSDISKPCTETAAKAIRLFIECLKKKEAPNKAARHLKLTSNDDIMRWVDDNELDLLHHVIILNNSEAVAYLLSNGYFQAPFEPRTNLYAHLACLMGHRTSLNILLQYRKDDNRASRKLTYCPNGLAVPTERHREIFPIDVAAEAGHLNCVKQILDQCIIKEYPEFAKYPYVALTCVPQSASSLKLVLKIDKPKPDDIRKAIEVTLQRSNAICLDILLKEKVNTKGMFNKMNFFHMLYTYSSKTEFGADGYKRLPDVTQILVKHKYDVNASTPPNTFPLYSLIRNALCIHDYVNTRHYVMCIRILMDAGADPNFDEAIHEDKCNARGVKTAHGRQAYSSALYCLLETVEWYSDYLESTALGVKFITQMAEVLLQNRVNINVVGRIGDQTSKVHGSVLHQFAKSSVKCGVENDVFKFLLRQGADPNSKVDGKYLINTYFDTLFPQLKEFNAFTKPPDYTENVEKILAVSMYMKRKSVMETLNIFKSDYGQSKQQHIRKYAKMAITQLEERVHEVWPLKRLCRTLIWDICSRDASRVHKLPTDIESRTYILPIL